MLLYFIFFFIDFGEGEKGRGREKWRQREREIEKNTELLFHLFMHSLVDSCVCPDWGSDMQPRLIGDGALTN